jgi:eukaryotic-like serine/threonine-protein kinase
VQSDRWARICRLFDQALGVESGRRSAWLDQLCGDDKDVRREVDSLLDAHLAAGEDFLERPAIDLHAELAERYDNAARIGRRIGDYQIVAEIGHGGMGEVYRASRADGQYTKEVAIKMVRLGWDAPALWERFRHERQILASLDHPNIARLIDGGATAEGTPYLVMELIAGTPIDQYCNEHRLNISARLQLYMQVCGAVQYAHDRSVVHRDLKPNNILVTEDGTPKLLDFGIAKILHSESTASTETIGRPLTPEYASPEQIRGETVTTASDQYSLGVLLYRLLVGQSPYAPYARSTHELPRAICESIPQRPSLRVRAVAGEAASNPRAEPRDAARILEGSTAKHLQRLKGDLDNIVLTALSKDPARRYPSVAALQRDIERHLSGLPVSARGDAWSYRCGKFLSRHRGGAALALALCFAVGAAWYAWHEHAGPGTEIPRSVAVLPLRDAEGRRSTDDLRRTITGDIAASLASVRGLSVRPFSASDAPSDEAGDPETAGRKLGVADIVSGSVAQGAGIVNVSLQVRDVALDRVIWRGSVSAPSIDAFKLHQGIVEHVRSAILPSLGLRHAQALDIPVPRNPRAFELYFRTLSTSRDPQPNKAAISKLEEAVRLDPGYGPAWGELAWRYYVDGQYSDGGPQSFRRSEEANERAVALDPNGIYDYVFLRVERGDLAGAYADALNFIRRRPDVPDSHFSMSYVLRYAGLLNEAASECEKGLALDSTYYVLRSCFIVMYQLGKYQRAYDYIALDGGSGWAQANRATVLIRQQRYAEALAAAIEGEQQRVPGADLLVAVLQSRPPAQIAESARRFEQFIDKQTDPEAMQRAATVLSFGGQGDAAIRLLRAAIRGHYCSFPAADNDPLFAPIRRRREFLELRSLGKKCQRDFLASRNAVAR